MYGILFFCKSPSATDGSSSAVRARPFPQLVWTTCGTRGGRRPGLARAEGPRHHRPRLRHETRRRGAASAASGPRKARAQTVASVYQSAPPPADRSVQRLMQRHRWTAPAHGWAARPRSCPPIGSATRSNRGCALPHQSAPRGAQR
jgi:hypothetical protein